MIIPKWLPLCLLMVGSVPAAAQNASVSGFVRDAETGETLLLANVVVAETGRGTATNAAGFYSLAGLQPGEYAIVFSYIGYRDQRIEMTLSPGEERRLDVELVAEGVAIDEVVVTADDVDEEAARRIGAARLPAQTVRQLPSVFEPDVFRSLQLLPGVKAASDFSSGLYIRGGSPDQTLILLDRNTVYNPTHFFGFFSTFNPDAIKDVRLYKGNYPVEFGGRLGSVVDVYNKDGNRRRRDGTVSVGLLASRGLVEGPMQNGSFMIAVRRSTLEPLLALLNSQDIEGIPESFYFYDVNGKLNFDLSRDDRLSLAFYGGQDDLRISPFDGVTIDITYGNQTGAVNWTHLFSPRLFSNFTMAGSRYFSLPEFRFADTDFRRANYVYDVSMKGDFEYVSTGRHHWKGGFWVGRFELRLDEAFDDEPSMSERIPSEYASLYLEDRYSSGRSWEVQAGLRANYFGGGKDFRLEPRLSFELRPAESTRFQFGYGRYNQFLTLITSEVFSGFDTWLTTGEGVSPSYGDQFGVGMKTALWRDLRVDVEAYYRTMRDLFELDPFVPDPSGRAYAELFRFGDGFAYGAELFVENSVGPVTGFFGYTFGVTRRRFPLVNEGRYYPPKYDRTHDLDLVAFLSITPSWTLTSAFTYGTGQAYTEPSSRYRLIADPFGPGVRDVLVTDYNNRRLPAYHRLDIGLTRKGQFFGIADYELQLQVINTYARRNTWFYLFDFQRDATVERLEVPQIPVPIPNIAFTLDF
ncbi:MAG: TonB-dependent receptor [Bacteroidota bacterium]